MDGWMDERTEGQMDGTDENYIHLRHTSYAGGHTSTAGGINMDDCTQEVVLRCMHML